MTDDGPGSGNGDETNPFSYLDPDDVVAFHADLFGMTLDQARARLRNPGGLESALNRPRHYAAYAGAGFTLQAAVLAHGIAEGQPFIDGNKRTTLVALYAFLEANGYRLAMAEDRLAALMLELSAGLTVEGLAERIAAALVSSFDRPEAVADTGR